MTSTFSRKPIIFVILLFLCASPLHSQLLWKISGKKLAKPSYLFGTHHLIPVNFLDSVPGLFKAFNNSDVVVGEMLMNTIDSSSKIMQVSMLPQGITMDSLLNEDDYALVDMELKSKLKIGLKDLGLMKPALIRTMYELELYKQTAGFTDEAQSDSYFQLVAEQKNKKIIGLEDVDTQIELLLGSKDQKREAQLLVETIRKKDEVAGEIEILNRLYKAGKIEDLVADAKKQKDRLSMTAEEYAKMVDNRNLKWLEVLPDYMKSSPCFIAVGAMHLGGESGLIQLLKEKGYKVKAVK